MKPLRPPNLHILRGALGWLELGNPQEALRELDQIPSPYRTHPDALEVDWAVRARQADWDRCISIAELLLAAAPERPTGWIDRSYALHELRRTQEAWDKLLPAALRFPHITTIPYNLACYACQLGDRDTALQWLERAMAAGDPTEVKTMALKDPDLAPLWK